MEPNVILSSEDNHSYILDNFKKIQNKPKNCDVIIQCNNGQVYCTKVLLAAGSSFWREVLADNDNDAFVFFPESNVRTMRNLIKFFSSGMVNMNHQEYYEIRDSISILMPEMDIKQFDMILREKFKHLEDLCRDWLPNLQQYDVDKEVKRAEMKRLRREVKQKQNKADCLNCHVHCPKPKKRGLESYKSFDTFEIDDEEKDYVCNICLSRFSRKEARDNHVKNIHFKEQTYLCKVCGKQLASKNGLEAHMNLHTDQPKHKCPECDKNYKTNSDLLKHCRAKGHMFPEIEAEEVTEADLRTKCTICHKYVLHFERHMNVYHCRKFKCHKCSFTTDRKDSLDKHMQLVHKLFNKKLGSISKNMKAKDKYGCFDCGNEYDKEEDIVDHITMLKDCNEIKCDQCDKIFTLRYNLNRHIRDVHDRKSYKCPHCDKEYSQERNRDRHAKNCRKHYK